MEFTISIKNGQKIIMGIFNFEIITKDNKTRARYGKMSTLHGTVETPAFMLVGTQAAVKGLTKDQLNQLGTQIFLCNTYHLYLRPGHERIKEIGGLHAFMNWDKPLLTDSGGFQVYSLKGLGKISEDGVEFSSHLDGSKHFFSPEKVIEIQESIGADILMPLDECIPYPSTREYVKKSSERTLAWLKRSKKSRQRDDQTLFGIVQGGMYEDLRITSTRQTVDLDMDGYAIGGFSVGETKEIMYPLVEKTAEHLPETRIRYMMGVGKPRDIVQTVAMGIDLFDCVIPTRNARNGGLFTNNGMISIKNNQYANQDIPIDSECCCFTCRTHSRAYLRHLHVSGEITGAILNTIHNVHFYLDLMRKIRQSIRSNRFHDFFTEFNKKNS